MTRPPVVRRLRRPAGRAAVSAVALLALAALAGCGGSSDDATSSSEPTTTTTTTPTDDASESPSDTPTEGVTTAPGPGGEEIPAQDFVDVYTAALDLATTARITMTVSGMTSRIDGAIDLTAEPPSVRMTIASDAAPTPQEVLLVGGYVYVQTADGSYSRTPAADNLLTANAALEGLDPRALLPRLSEAVTEATTYGAEDVDGEVFMHYSVVLDTAAVLGTAAPDLPDALTLDTYVDGAGLLRRLTVDLGGATGLVDVRYDSWGEPVTIKAPPEGQVQDAPTR